MIVITNKLKEKNGRNIEIMNNDIFENNIYVQFMRLHISASMFGHLKSKQTWIFSFVFKLTEDIPFRKIKLHLTPKS